MAINNEFYEAVNSLVSQGTTGEKAIVDYASFIDYGKKATDLSVSNDLQNVYMTGLLNRIKMVINDNPTYVGQYADIVLAGGDPGEIIQTIMTTFYQATYNRALQELESGETYTDQFEYNAVEGLALYHCDTNGKEFAISIPDKRWNAAWMTPEALDEFNRSQMNGVLNSTALAAEAERMAQIADVINKALGTTPNETDENAGSMNYDLLKIYNDTYDTELTQDNCLGNDDFTRRTLGVVSDVSDLMAKVSTKFNLHGSDTKPWKTFTPKEYQRLKVNSIFKKAIRRAMTDAYHNDLVTLPDVATEYVPYWQNQDDRLRVNDGTGTPGTDTPVYGAPVLAVLFDKRRVMQVVQMDDVASARENRLRYTSYFWQTAFMAYSNEYANAIVFTIKGGSD